MLIQEYAAELAAQLGIALSKISVTDGRSLGCRDTDMLNLTLNGKLVSVLIHPSERSRLQTGDHCDLLELKVRSALLRLQMSLGTAMRES